MSQPNEGPSPLMRMMINNHIHQHDVSALKSEVERLRAIIESNLNVCKKMVSQSDAFRIERDVLKAENERLHKAGDAMAKWFNDGGFYGFGFQEAWLAAKEGRDAK